MNRRGFVRLAARAVVGAMVLDPERLLWVPGRKTFHFLTQPSLPVGVFVRIVNGQISLLDSLDLELGDVVGVFDGERVVTRGLVRALAWNPNTMGLDFQLERPAHSAHPAHPATPVQHFLRSTLT